MKAIAVPVIIAFFASIFTGAAQANVYSDCQAAIDAGDRDQARGPAEMMLRFNVIYDTKNRKAISECLTFAMEEQYFYDPLSASFMSTSEMENRAETYAKREEEQEQERKMQAEIAASAAEFEQHRREQESAKRRAVWLRVSEACGRLYKKRPDETVTNRICLDLFLATGLPDD
ncbi:MAG: hypothetical protein COC12_12060 [Rhodobacteraceae bacterium]|nr:MAG: hypothetical protein COC12_12060 [Paracoccaceae bacterium]